MKFVVTAASDYSLQIVKEINTIEELLNIALGARWGAVILYPAVNSDILNPSDWVWRYPTEGAEQVRNRAIIYKEAGVIGEVKIYDDYIE